MSHGAAQVAVADIDGDRRAEVIAGIGAMAPGPSYIVVYDGVTGAERVRIANPDSVPNSLAIGDMDGDGRMDIVIGMERPSTGPDRLYVYDAQSGQLKWNSTDEATPVRAVAKADLTGSGLIESPAKVLEMWTWELEATAELGGCFTLTNHPFLSGRPSRAVLPRSSRPNTTPTVQRSWPIGRMTWYADSRGVPTCSPSARASPAQPTTTSGRCARPGFRC